ncbi:MAG TPA: hypothetical protein VKU00_21825 [Chthonomonadaceae bacterium]|nr:hypothetical protein [Chthonomonadaceae bacterium]
MRVLFRNLALCVLGLGIVLNVGCGGGGTGAPVSVTKTTQQGSLSMQILFPKPLTRSEMKTNSRSAKSHYSPGAIPDGSFAVKIVLSDPVSGNPIVPTRIVTAPIGLSGSLASPITINYPALPVGNVNVAVTAHGLTDASDPPLATGNSQGTVVPLGNTVVHILLNLTANSIKMVPARQSVGFGQQGSVTATVFDKQGNTLLTPLQFSTNDPDLILLQNTGTSPATINMTVTNPNALDFAATVTVTEPDSGLTTSVTVNVMGG